MLVWYPFHECQLLDFQPTVPANLHLKSSSYWLAQLEAFLHVFLQLDQCEYLIKTINNQFNQFN